MVTPADKFPNRNEYLGGSDLAAALGVSPYKSPLEVYLEKTGELPPPDLSDNDAVHFGVVLEDTVADEFSRRKQVAVRRDNRELIHGSLPFLRGHIDRRIVGVNEGLECKTANWRMGDQFGEQGSDEVPEQYLIQCMAYLAVTGWDKWHLAVLIGGNDFRTYEIPRDDELIDILEKRAAVFWQQVEARTPPDPKTLAEIRIRYPQDDGSSIPATAEIESACSNLATLKATLKDLETQKDGIEGEIKKFMGEHSAIVGSDGKPLATWKTAKGSTRFDAKKLQAEMPDIYAKYSFTAQGSRRFLLK